MEPSSRSTYTQCIKLKWNGEHKTAWAELQSSAVQKIHSKSIFSFYPFVSLLLYVNGKKKKEKSFFSFLGYKDKWS